MNENTKTIAFLAVAAIVVLGVWITKPALVDEGAAVQGTLLFPDFKDPLAAASLSIVKYDEATGEGGNPRPLSSRSRMASASHER